MLKNNDLGLTLFEVLISLVIAGVITGIVFSLYLNHYRVNKEIINKMELEYSLLRAGQVLATAVRSAEKVQWDGQKLEVTFYYKDKLITDSFYLADKDVNGIQDLYREHLSVPNPIASYLTKLHVEELRKGLWRLILEAEYNNNHVKWERKVRQIVCLN